MKRRWRAFLVGSTLAKGCTALVTWGAPSGLALAAIARSSSSSSSSRHLAGGGGEVDQQRTDASDSKNRLRRDKIMQPRLEELLHELESKGRSQVKKSRQHVNPLAKVHQVPVELQEGWFSRAFDNPQLPLCVDIGAAYGKFCLDSALAHPEMNYLGIEIRRPVAAVALARAAEKGIGNCYYISANANVDFERIAGDVKAAGARLHQVTIQFPDPHFKKRNWKRRVLQPPLVKSVASALEPGGILYMQGDILEVQEEMRRLVRDYASDSLVDARENFEDWMSNEPALDVVTEREVATKAKGEPVYRCIFTKRDGSSSQ